MIEYPYGVRSPSELSPLEIELIGWDLNKPPEEGGIGRAAHFWNICELLWPAKSSKPFLRHPWAEKQVAELARWQYLGIVGCASSGKTDTCSVWSIINWLVSPMNTLVLVTSTSLKDSRKRIWGSVTAYFQAAAHGLPGKLKDSVGMIGTIDPDSGEANNDKCGIALIPGEKKKEKEAIGKLIGMKNLHVILICDELPELSPALIEAAYSNLAIQVGAEATFQMVGIGNFASMYDPLGQFVKPKGGYNSIDEGDEEWETERGYCIRFDGLRSPNILEGRDKTNEYPCYNSRHLKEHRASFGENSAAFWRMCRSFPSKLGLDNCIYSDADFIAGGANDKPLWLYPPVVVSALDPSFTNEGDRCIQLIGHYGRDVHDRWILSFVETIELHDDVNVQLPRDYQIVRQFRDNNLARGIPPQYAAIDCTGAGAVLLSIIQEEWDRNVLGINFSGKASDLPISATDDTLASQKFDRRVSELWWMGREFMKYGQIKGITPDMATEMKARKYDTVKGPEGLKMRVETKKEMKKRVGFSPDIADCAFVMLDLCRQRLNALPGGVLTGMNQPKQQWEEEVAAATEFYMAPLYQPEPTIAEPGGW